MLRNLVLLVLLAIGFPTQADSYLDDWQQLLGVAVKEGSVDYSRWRHNSLFDGLVEKIAGVEIGAMNSKEKLAFYINTYNILAARGILDGSSPSSLIGRYSYFKRDKYQVAGRRINLHDLENDLIRPLGESRIHFAIVCASQSCPILRGEPYTPEHIDEQLDLAAREFINDPRRNRFDSQTGKAELSMIFDWFEEDFVVGTGSLQHYLSDYARDPVVASMLRQGTFRITHLTYNWDLNGEL